MKMITGMVVLDLEWENGRMVVLQENDHILRRFGQVDVIKLVPNESLETHRVSGADEIWTVLEGEANLRLTDRREESPTVDQSMEIKLSEETPRAVLIPFGVLGQISSQAGAAVLRISSHADELYPQDRIFMSTEKV